MTEQARSEKLEPGGVSAGRVTIVAGGFAALLVASLIGLGVVFYAAVPRDRTPAAESFPRPRLEADPAAELHALQSKQHQELNVYRWANGEHTLVAIPIERAMAIVAQRGADAFAPIATAKPAPRPSGGKP
jgi:hypothetical protein